MRNITDIFEATSLPQAKLNAKIKEICTTMGTYDEERNFWVYIPEKPFWTRKSYRDGRQVRIWPILKALAMSKKGVCGLVFDNKMDYETDEYFLTVEKFFQKNPYVCFAEADHIVGEEEKKEITDSILNYKKRRYKNGYKVS